MLVCAFCDEVFRDDGRHAAIDQRTDHYVDAHQDALQAILNPETREVSSDA